MTSFYMTGLITDRALATAGTKVDDFSLWKDHWFDTANAMLAEFAFEGLLKSADEVRLIIAEQHRFCSAS